MNKHTMTLLRGEQEWKQGERSQAYLYKKYLSGRSYQRNTRKLENRLNYELRTCEVENMDEKILSILSVYTL